MTPLQELQSDMCSEVRVRPHTHHGQHVKLSWKHNLVGIGEDFPPESTSLTRSKAKRPAERTDPFMACSRGAHGPLAGFMSAPRPASFLGPTSRRPSKIRGIGHKLMRMKGTCIPS